jgi:hypothetical protein
LGPPGPGAVIRDAEGQLVGLVVAPDYGSLTLVLRRVGAANVPVRFWVGGPDDGRLFAVRGVADQFFYESADCSGAALVIPTHFGQYSFDTFVTLAGADAGIGYPGQSSFFSVRSEAMGAMSQQMCATYNGGLFFIPPDRCCIANTGSGMMSPVEIFDAASLGLSVPYVLEGP